MGEATIVGTPVRTGGGPHRAEHAHRGKRGSVDPAPPRGVELVG